MENFHIQPCEIFFCKESIFTIIVPPFLIQFLFSVSSIATKTSAIPGVLMSILPI